MQLKKYVLYDIYECEHPGDAPDFVTTSNNMSDIEKAAASYAADCDNECTLVLAYKVDNDTYNTRLY